MKPFKRKDELARIKFINGDRYWILPEEELTFGAHYILITNKDGITTAYPHVNIVGISFGHKLSELDE